MNGDTIRQGGTIVMQAADVLIDDAMKASCASQLSSILLLNSGALEPGTTMDQVRPTRQNRIASAG